MFSYFGSKVKFIHLYPPPDYDTIIEPFAGSARYALRFWERDVWINDIYPVIAEAWRWIIQLTTKQVRALPDFQVGDKLSDFTQLEEPAKYVLGFSCNPGSTSPRNQVTKRGMKQLRYIKRDLLKTVGRFRHWIVTSLSYALLTNFRATWFIDPPYQNQGKHYIHDCSGVDFNHLAQWSRDRRGQVIVCEGMGADWLPFHPLLRIPKNVMQAKNRKKVDEKWYSEVLWHKQDKKVGFGVNKVTVEES